MEGENNNVCTSCGGGVNEEKVCTSCGMSAEEVSNLTEEQGSEESSASEGEGESEM